jgi:hypothetical protein
MVTTSPVHQGEREISRNTIVQGMPDRFGVPVVTMLVCFLHLHTRLRVRHAPGIPCALYLSEGRRSRDNSGESRRENAKVRLFEN